MTAYAIRTESLSRHFGDVRAVDGLSLEVPVGKVFGFLGPNGAGKTTVIRLLLGLIEPSAGQAEVLGFDVRGQGAEVRQRCGALLEHPGLYERLSAEENLEFYGRIWRLDPASRRARVRELLAPLGLWERRKEAVQNWSRGEKQKLAVARAMLHRSALIFLDEPTAGLDPVAAASLREDLTNLAACEGVTVFLTTHNLDEAGKLCGQVGVIRSGKLMAVGSPEELRATGRTPRAEIIGRGFSDELLGVLRARPEVAGATVENGRLRIDLRGEPSLAPLVSLIARAGGEIEEVRQPKASLEEVFLALVEEDRCSPTF